MSGFDKRLKRVIKLAEAHDAGWSWDRPKELLITEHDTFDSLITLFSIHFSWFRHRWEKIEENHKNVLINILGSHPVMLSHIWKILDKNFNENNEFRHGHWILDEMEFVLMEKLGLLSDDCEVEVYRLKPKEE
jgi:hypothetical protein